MAIEMQNQKATVEFLQRQLEAERLRSKSLEGELEAEKMKTEGMQMLFDCMQEEHCENRRLKNILRQRKLALRKLKKRLQTNPNGIDQINWDEFSDFSEVEEFAEKGIRNSYLKQPSREEQPSQNLELQKPTEELTCENEQFNARLKRSCSEKDAEMPTDGTQLHESMSEEVIDLKRHLMGTAEMCQKLMQLLETKQGLIKKNANFKPSEDKISDADITVVKLQEQYGNLEMQLKEVVTMNSRWQQYNEQREEYVQELLQRNVELEQAVVNNGGQPFSLGQQERVDQILIDQKQKLELTTEETLTLKKDNQCLRNRLEQIQDEHNEVIQKLREQYAHDTTKYKNAVREHLETIETLKLQIQTYREDFESERRDRENAQDHVIQLEAQIQSATKQLSLNRINSSPGQMQTSDLHLHVPQLFSPEASLVGRGTFSTVIEDQFDSGELDLRPSD